jgi:hypothetical protein
MNIKLVKQGARITFYNGIYMILFGLFYIFFVKFNMNTNFSSIDQLWGFFARYSNDISYLFYLFNVLIGLFLISSGITTMYLSDFIIKRKDKMTWVILFMSGLIAWGGLFIISVLFKNWILITLSFIGWIDFVVGMVLPIKYYLQKSYKEY